MMRRNVLFKALLGLGLLGMAGYATAADIRIDNQDAGTGQGLDDPTPITPVGGNPGVTRGEQARIVFQFAADIWGAVLQSDTPITVSASFARLECDATSGVLGSAGTTSVFSFANPAPPGALSGTWYHSALFDALAGEDADPGFADIRARFNGALGSLGCLQGASWYFGLDDNQPAGSINFLNVVLHEMAHGLGFSGFGNLGSGQPLPGGDGVGRPDIYSTFVFNNTQNASWYGMTPAQRITAAVDDGNLVFTGANVKAEAPLALNVPLLLRVSAPAAVAGDYAFSAGAIGPVATPANFNGMAVMANGPSMDGTTTNAEACAPITNVAQISGHVAIVDRGTCAFTDKVLNVQAAGASAVLIANNQPGIIIPGGDTAGIIVAVGAISQVDGAKLKANAAGLTLGLALGSQMAGADAAGNVQVYAPTELAVGSSFSHYDTRLTPNAVMEFAINDDLAGHLDLDLTPALFKDEGWLLNEGTQSLLTCDTGIPTWVPGGIVIGANVLANAKILAAAAPSVGDYRATVHTYAANLAGAGLIDGPQASSLNACLGDAETLAQWQAWNASAPPPPVALTPGVFVAKQGGAPGSSRIYTLDVPAGAVALTMSTLGGSGDVSMYVKIGSAATPSDFTWKSTRARSNTERVSIGRPVPGTYYITVFGESDYSGVTVLGNFTVR